MPVACAACVQQELSLACTPGACSFSAVGSRVEWLCTLLQRCLLQETMKGCQRYHLFTFEVDSVSFRE